MLFAYNCKKGEFFQHKSQWFIAESDATYQDASDLEDGWDISLSTGSGMYVVAREATQEEISAHLAAIEAAKNAHSAIFATLPVGSAIKVRGDSRTWTFVRYERKEIPACGSQPAFLAGTVYLRLSGNNRIFDRSESECFPVEA